MEHSEHFRKDGMAYVKISDDIGSATSEEEAKWVIIRQIIDDYARIHPKEIAEDLKICKILRESMAHTGKKDSSLRWGFRCSPAIVRLIERKFPDFFTHRKNISQFMKRFPGFTIAESV